MSVKIYTTPSCVYCRMAKEFFKKNNVEFQELNVVQDDKARDEMVKKSRQLAVPVIDVNGEIFVGFDQRGLKKALGIA
ncbi:MAG: glutathione S-transferase N-terminal domain-containing protein [Candidatus Liptonbacteria bacterium]|nr:glutathione S-transferase N-terminal domain-containing protein [Candidatus Liptonbacteria bacterium]